MGAGGVGTSITTGCSIIAAGSFVALSWVVSCVSGGVGGDGGCGGVGGLLKSVC